MSLRGSSSFLLCSWESLLSGFLGMGLGDGLLAKVIHRVAALCVISQPSLARGDDSRRNFPPLTCGIHLKKDRYSR